MANVLGTLFQDIADAIRGKTGDTAAMKPADFPQAISAIASDVPDGYIKPSGELAVTENGTYDVTNYADVNVAVPESGGSGGSGEWIFASGSFDPTSATYTVEHNLGVVPDIIFLYVQGSGNPTGSSGYVMSIIQISEKMFGNAAVTNNGEIILGAKTYYYPSGTNKIVSTGTTKGLENHTSANADHGIYDVTDTTFTVGVSYRPLSTALGYAWCALAQKS